MKIYLPIYNMTITVTEGAFQFECASGDDVESRREEVRQFLDEFMGKSPGFIEAYAMKESWDELDALFQLWLYERLPRSISDTHL